jgi:hypothetical protein
MVFSAGTGGKSDRGTIPLIQSVLHVKIQSSAQFIDNILKNYPALIKRSLKTISGVTKQMFARARFKELPELIGANTIVLEITISSA